jgi:hypothetical protein
VRDGGGNVPVYSENAVAGYLGALLAARECFQCDELMFEQHIQICTIQPELIGSVLDQHQGCELMRAQHLCLLLIGVNLMESSTVLV